MTLFKLLKMNMFCKFLWTMYRFFLAVFFLLGINLVSATVLGNDDDEYIRVITKRSEKIVDKLNVEASEYPKVLKIIMQQYQDLNHIDTDHSHEKATINKINNGDQRADLFNRLHIASEKKREKLHHQYLKKLNRYLTESQVEQVKNEMTYNVLPITYKNYMDMLPKLTAAQQRQILVYLIEAREKAMDAGSAKEKHAWFGKYKGKINNYLSAEGVETKKAREEWERKLKERQAKQ